MQKRELRLREWTILSMFLTICTLLSLHPLEGINHCVCHRVAVILHRKGDAVGFDEKDLQGLAQSTPLGVVSSVPLHTSLEAPERVHKGRDILRTTVGIFTDVGRTR